MADTKTVELIPLGFGIAELFGLLRPSTLAEVIIDLQQCRDHDTDELLDDAIKHLAANCGMTDALGHIINAANGL